MTTEVDRGEEEGQEESGEEEGQQEEGGGQEGGQGGRAVQGRRQVRLSGLPLLCSEAVGSLLVEYSGGKDSRVVLDLALQVCARVEAVLYALLPGLDSDQPALDWAASRGVRVHVLPHPELAACLSDGSYGPHVRGREGLARYGRGWNRVRELARVRSGIDWIATGMRSADSWFRRGQLSRIGGGGVDRPGRILHPIHNWTQTQVLRYMRTRRIPRPVVVGGGSGKTTSAISLRTGALRDLARDWPADFRRLERVFPWIRAALLRPAPRTGVAGPEPEQGP